MSTVSVAASYRGLFAEPVLRRLAVADVCARLPQGMVSITLLLVAAQHASMAVAGLVVAGYTLGQAVTGPVRGRLADRRGLIPVAVACGTGYALALLALLGCALAKAPAGLPSPPRPAPPSPGMHDNQGTQRASFGRKKGQRRGGAGPRLRRQAQPGGSALSSWTPRRVLDAAIAMEWRPHGAIEVLADDYRLIRYPDWALDPVLPAAHVTRSRTGQTQRPADEIIDEVAARVRRWGLHGVAWWVSSATRPPDTEKALCARGGKQIDAVQILARELSGGLPDLDVPAGVRVKLVADERTFRAASMVTVRGWGRREPTGAALAREFTEAIRSLETWSSFRVVAMIGQEPASSGGCTLHGEVAQLWGAVTLREYRRRGSYRAVLAERLRLAREHGAALALVKGRVETSGPILLRAGFADYGQERCYWLSI